METNTIAVPMHVIEALSKVLEYLWHDEQKDFQAASRKRKEKHIYRTLTVLNRWQTNPLGPPDYFGDCPECEHGGNDGYVNIGPEHWTLCHVHKLKWCVGENLFSSWRHESTADWEENRRFIAHYRKIPIPTNPEDSKRQASE